MKQRLLNPQAARRLIAALLLLFMTLPLAWGDTTTPWKGEIADQIEEGEGTAEKPILIKTAEELAYLAKTVNEKGMLKVNGQNDIDGSSGFLGYYFALSNNINLNGIDWTPIGKNRPAGRFFEGHFDGKGHCIEGLTVGSENNQYPFAGLFGYVQNGTIQNLGVRLAGGIWGSGYAGGIVGLISSSKDYPATLRNCYVEGPGGVISKGQSGNCAGGIAGSTEDTNTTLSHCYAIVDVEASGGSSGNYAGGIAGYGTGNISYTYATGSIRASGSGNNRAGGICGLVNQNTTLSNSLALNKDIVGDENHTHRVAGDALSSLTNNYASPEIYVNGKPANSQEANGLDGSDEDINLSNYISQLGSSWVNNNADLTADPWDSSNKSLLPKLRIVASDDGKGKLTYGAWTNSPQPDLLATNYLIATEIENDGGDADSGNSWDKPIYIANRAELAYFAQQVNAGGLELKLKNGESINNRVSPSGKYGFSGYYFALSNDIDLTQYHWTPIGIDPLNNKSFSGHFDGKGHCIEGLTVGSENNQYTFAGLFGYVQNGTIQNLGVRLAGGIWGNGYAGGIVGCIMASTSQTSATLRNCYVEGPGVVMSKGDYNNNAGGIVGYTENTNTNTTLSHCYAIVDVEASGGSSANDAGGIAGYGSGNISYTYATGSIRASGSGNNRAGGICGLVNQNTTLSNNLALNKEIVGDDNLTHRVAGYAFTSMGATLTNNYASLQTRVNNASAYNQDPASRDGSDAIHIDDYEKALKTDVTDVNKQPWVLGGTTHLPKLKMLINNDPDNPEYAAWPVTTQPAQPTLLPANYLPAKFTLHIVTPNGGSVTVKDGAGNEIPDEAVVYPGTTLTLSYSENDDYEFVSFLSGNGQDNLTECTASLTMSESDLWVSAEFKEKPKPEPDPTPDPDPDPTPDPPYVPVYFTVTLPSVEGATTDPAPGDYKVESWDNFRFYLTLNPDYSESQPVVTTSRGETIQPRKSDGAYLVKYVRSDVQLFIDGIQLNNPTANADIEADALRIYAVGSTLMISAPRTAEAMVCDLSGRLLRTCNILPGLTRIEGLRAGIYIVKVNGFEGVKVVIR